MPNIDRLEAIVAELPEAERVDIAEWGGHPSFRVGGKNFLFSNLSGTSVSFKLSHEEANVVVGSDSRARSMGYGLGRHGWVDVELGDGECDWDEVREWVRTSYTLIAPKPLAEQVLAEDGMTEDAD